MLEINNIYNIDCREGLKLLDDNSIDCCVTSPPYWGLRDYGVEGQIGLEDSLQEYIDEMVNVFREVKRVLKPEGTLWLNLGDSYVGTGGDRKNKVKNELFQIQQEHGPKDGRYSRTKKIKNDGLKPKDLIGIPWRVAFALQEDGSTYGIWGIDVVEEGKLFERKVECWDEDADLYSDIVFFKEGIKNVDRIK